MQLKKNKKVSKKSLIITLVVILLIASAGTYFVIQHNSQNLASSTTQKTNKIDYGNASNDQVAAGQSAKSNNLKDTNTDTPPSPSAQPGSSKKVAQVSLTAKNQTDQTYQIRAQIDGLLSNGTCTLTLTKGGSTVTKTAPTQALSNTSTCTGFDIPLSELSTGTWQLSLTAEDQTVTGTTTSTITVQ